MTREIQKYHDGRYRSVDAVYLCGEIGNPDKERLFVPLDKVLEIIDQMDKENEECNGDPARWLLRIEHQDFRERVEALKGGEQE